MHILTERHPDPHAATLLQPEQDWASPAGMARH